MFSFIGFGRRKILSAARNLPFSFCRHNSADNRFYFVVATAQQGIAAVEFAAQAWIAFGLLPVI
jgi:hypothetical protein